jgi:leucyl-tRNA synthetase
MSKRFGNVINPDDIVSLYGADTLRVYEMFMGPFSDAIKWNTESIIGSRRFLDRVWKLQFKISKKQKIKNENLEILLNQTIKKVGEDIISMKLNTAISSMMTLVSEMEKLDVINGNDFESFVLILSPFAPHLAEELWHILGHKKSVVIESWPKYDPKKIIKDTTRIGVQVNGRVRGDIEVSFDADEKEAVSLAKGNQEIYKWIEGKEIKKVIYIKGKILNILV